MPSWLTFLVNMAILRIKESKDVGALSLESELKASSFHPEKVK